MVKVPEYQRTETLRPAFRQGIDVQASPEAFGAAVGRGMAQAGQAVGQVADAVQKIQDFDNTNAAKDADNNFAKWTRERMYGEGGFMTLEGRNAVEARAKFDEEVEAKRKEFGATLKPGAANMYQRASEARATSIGQQAITHQAQERKTWFKETSDARLSGFASDALASYAKPALVQKNIAAGLLEIDGRGQMEGWDGDKLKVERSKYTSGVHSSVALRMADENAIAADAYLKANKDAFLEADRQKIEAAIERPLLAAKAEANLQAITGGLPPANYAAPSGPIAKVGGVAGTDIFRQSVGGLMGLNENAAPGPIKDFIKRSAGIDIDPRVTPWCAAFVNAVLGAQGVKGNGSLAARSFMQFGMKTDDPKPGDIVVLKRGSDTSKGHVGFFQGYDANGNILVLGGNQGSSGAVSVAAMNKGDLLGFRTAGKVDAATAQLPNYNPATLGTMYDKANAIRDPKEREATLDAIDRYYTRQKRVLDQNKDQVRDDLEKRMIADPSFDPSKLPVSVQQVIGMSGMNALQGWRDAKTKDVSVKTDLITFDQLLTDQAMDPAGFATRDLLPYRGKLSDSDYLSLRAKQRGAVADLSRETREGAVYKEAFNVSEEFYGAAGIATGSSARATSDANKTRKAQFNGAVREEVDQFIQEKKRKPTYDELRTIAAGLTMKVVGSEKRGAWSPGRLFDDDQDDVYEGRVFERGSAPAGIARRIVPSYANVPPEWVAPIKTDLSKKLGRAPTNTEIATEWGNIAIQMIGNN